ncbi:MAG: hypothetical protein HQ492_06885 [Woeseiaceae bacterium]|nr:hypothetical protein [Woeseiaceae bacterium]
MMAFLSTVAAFQVIVAALTDGLRQLYLAWLKGVVPAILCIMLVLYVADSIT